MSREKVVIVGLGYVGLPLACLAAEKGHQVFGYALDNKKVELINKKISPILDRGISDWLTRVEIKAANDPAVIGQGQVVIICVPTPVDQNHMPDLGPLTDALGKVSENMQPRTLVVIESTINPGVCEEVALPILEKGKRKAGIDFGLAHCPERINPGDQRWNVRNIPRVVGAINEESLQRAKAFYQSIIEAPIYSMKSLKEAEAVKIIENSFRDVNIAFVNELAKSFDGLGVDLVNVINGANTKPFAFMAHYPSCGIGGHCIPVDPYYLIEQAKKQTGFSHDFLKLARQINNSMPAYATEKLAKIMEVIGRPLEGATVGLLGIAYKADVGDDRESPYYAVKKELTKRGARVLSFDPFIPKKSDVSTIDEILEKSDAVFLVTNHRQFIDLKPEPMARAGVKAVLDGKNVWDRTAFESAGIAYAGIGR